MYTDPEFADPTEMMKYVYNSCTASGRIGDGLDLLRSQKRHLAFDYKFATQEGAVLFNIHVFLDLKDELQLLLFDLIKEKMPIWKQMRALEIVAAIVAETLMEMSVTILTTPEEIHWPMGCITWLGAQTTNKKGKKTTKKQGGIFGNIVYEYTPKTPPNDTAQSKKCEGPSTTTTVTRSNKGKVKTAASIGNDETQTCSDHLQQHEGLPVQEQKCTSYRNEIFIFPHLIGYKYKALNIRLMIFFSIRLDQ